MERKAELLQQAGQQRHQLQTQQAADSEREYAAYLAEEQQKLREVLPEWRDTRVRDAETKVIAEFLLKSGYSQDDLRTLADHRALLIARKAAKWDLQQSIKAKQAQATPAKTVPPGARTQPQATTVRADDMRRKALRTHSNDDIVAFMLAKET